MKIFLFNFLIGFYFGIEWGIFSIFFLFFILRFMNASLTNPFFSNENYKTIVIYFKNSNEHYIYENLKSGFNKTKENFHLKKKIILAFGHYFLMPAQKFKIEDHLQIINENFENKKLLTNFIELCLLDLFIDESIPKWKFFITKNGIVICKYADVYEKEIKKMLKINEILSKNKNLFILFINYFIGIFRFIGFLLKIIIKEKERQNKKKIALLKKVNFFEFLKNDKQLNLKFEKNENLILIKNCYPSNKNHFLNELEYNAGISFLKTLIYIFPKKIQLNIFNYIYRKIPNVFIYYLSTEFNVNIDKIFIFNYNNDIFQINICINYFNEGHFGTIISNENTEIDLEQYLKDYFNISDIFLK